MGSKKSHGRDWRGGEAVAVRQWRRKPEPRKDLKKKWQDVLFTGICLTKKVPQEEEKIMPKNMHYPHKISN